MIELNQRKHKINLADYDYENDIRNRVLLSTFSKLELEVLEEILFHPLKFPTSDLSRNLEIRMDELNKILSKLQETELFSINNDQISVNKDARRYFELQIMRFEEDFEPGMDFLQQLLKIIPIHILPNWYHIPRTSDNIFDSLVEKYLVTPQVFQRHLMDLNIGNETLLKIIKDLFSTSELRLSVKEIQEKYSLNNTTLQEFILLLEYNFVSSLVYENTDNGWEGFITPFKEWKDYLLFLKNTTPSSIQEQVITFRPHDYAFSEDMATLLKASKNFAISVIPMQNQESYAIDSQHFRFLADALQDFDLSHEKHLFETYVNSLLSKLLLLKLAFIDNNYLKMSEDSINWCNLPSEKRALHTYRHPFNQIQLDVDKTLLTDKNIREVEKSVGKVVNLGWVYLEEFMRGLIVPLNDKSRTTLQKTGKTWRYAIPEYSDPELRFIRSTIMDWLFESGIIQTGRHLGKPCFRVTHLGKTLFGD